MINKKLKDQFEKAYCLESFNQQFENYERVSSSFALSFINWYFEKGQFMYPNLKDFELLECFKKQYV